jgi:hypothetical protein
MMEAKRRQAIPILRLLGSDHYRPHRQRRLAEAPAHASHELLFLFNLACEECILPRYYLHVMFPLSSNPVGVSDITHVSLSPSFILLITLDPFCVRRRHPMTIDLSKFESGGSGRVVVYLC